MEKKTVVKVDENNYETALISKSLKQALLDLKIISGKTMDLNIMEVEISGHKCAVVSIEGMASTSAMAELIFRPLMEFDVKGYATEDDIFKFLTKQSLLAAERKIQSTYGEVFLTLFSGFAVIFIDGCDKCVAFGIQGFDKRSIDEPTSDGNIKGSHEGFIDTIRTNISLVRRRLKTPKLRFDMQQIGSDSKTDVCVAYITDKAPQGVIDKVKENLNKIDLDTIITSGYIEPFLEGDHKSIFTNVLSTDRPDTFCAKLNEGRVGVLIDGVPFALICPSLFIENFQTIDDYVNKPFYTTYIRWIKYAAFFLSIALPGVCVAIATCHPEILTHKFLMNLAASEEVTPYSFFFEALIITIMYEIMREAGIRLPKAVGGAVSIVGALIIGDAAVSSSLVSAPLLIIIGLTATASFVIPNLNPQTSILRILFILAGGFAGLFGVTLCFAFTMINISALESFGVPYNAPLSPFTFRAIRDVASRPSFKKLGKSKTIIEHLNGVNKI